MRSDYIHISKLLDRSGSMSSIKNDIIGGFNTFLEEQKKLPGKLSISLVQFDNEYEPLLDFRDIKDAKPLTDDTFQPRGSTALFDSVIKLIGETGKKLAEMNEDDRPSKVLFVILTDGLDNTRLESFRHWLENTNRKAAAAEAIKHQQEKYNWQFVFIGADQDAFKVGESLGIKGTKVKFAKSAVGTDSLYRGFNDSTVLFRANSADADYSFNLSQDDVVDK